MHMSFVYSLCRPLSQRNILDLKEQGIGTLAQTLKTAVPGGRPTLPRGPEVGEHAPDTIIRNSPPVLSTTQATHQIADRARKPW